MSERMRGEKIKKEKTVQLQDIPSAVHKQKEQRALINLSFSQFPSSF